MFHPERLVFDAADNKDSSADRLSAAEDHPRRVLPVVGESPMFLPAAVTGLSRDWRLRNGG